jgi:hypothetical protein
MTTAVCSPQGGNLKDHTVRLAKVEDAYGIAKVPTIVDFVFYIRLGVQ